MGLEGSSDGPSWTSREKDSMHIPCWGHSTWEGNTSRKTGLLTAVCHCHFSPAHHTKATISEQCLYPHARPNTASLHSLPAPTTVRKHMTVQSYACSYLSGWGTEWQSHSSRSPSLPGMLGPCCSNLLPTTSALWGGWEASSAVPTPVSARSPTAEHTHPHSHRGGTETNMISTDLSEEKPANTLLPTSGKLPPLSQPPLPPPALGSSLSPSKHQWLLYIHLGLWIIWFPLVACEEETVIKGHIVS